MGGKKIEELCVRKDFFYLSVLCLHHLYPINKVVRHSFGNAFKRRLLRKHQRLFFHSPVQSLFVNLENYLLAENFALCFGQPDGQDEDRKQSQRKIGRARKTHTQKNKKQRAGQRHRKDFAYLQRFCVIGFRGKQRNENAPAVQRIGGQQIYQAKRDVCGDKGLTENVKRRKHPPQRYENQSAHRICRRSRQRDFDAVSVVNAVEFAVQDGAEGGNRYAIALIAAFFGNKVVCRFMYQHTQCVKSEDIRLPDKQGKCQQKPEAF